MFTENQAIKAHRLLVKLWADQNKQEIIEHEVRKVKREEEIVNANSNLRIAN